MLSNYIYQIDCWIVVFSWCVDEEARHCRSTDAQPWRTCQVRPVNVVVKADNNIIIIINFIIIIIIIIIIAIMFSVDDQKIFGFF